jgi:hypothetical protein
MSNEILIVIVAINAVMTLSLWRMMATKVSRPAGLNKKAAKALWHSDPIVPRHDPPKAAGGDFSSRIWAFARIRENRVPLPRISVRRAQS